MSAEPTPLQVEMLRAGTVRVDGWTSQRGREALAGLAEAGLMELSEGGSDEAQHTYVAGRVTAAGRAWLERHGDPLVAGAHGPHPGSPETRP